MVLKSILDCGALMKPGDRLLDGTQLIGTKCAGRQDRVFYTSPTVRYAGLKYYARPQCFEVPGGSSDDVAATGLAASMVLQCRQKPTSYQCQGETMGFEQNWPGHLQRWCPHVQLSEIEWMSDTNVAAIPYRLLVRVFDVDTDKEYQSPIDAQLDLVSRPNLRPEQPALPAARVGGDQASTQIDQSITPEPEPEPTPAPKSDGVSRPASPNPVTQG